MSTKRSVVQIIFLLFACSGWSSAAALPAPKISATPASLNFGPVKLGETTAQKSIAIKNSGTIDLTISDVSITGTNADEFGKDNRCGTVPPGGTCLVNMTLTPVLPYAKKAVLAITSDDPKKQVLKIKLTGTASPPKISASPASLKFGKLPEGTGTATKSLTIKNSGVSDLIVNSIMLWGTNSEDFSINGHCDTIPMGGTCTVNVLFEPKVPAAKRTATMDISSNDPKKSTVHLKLSGQGGSQLATYSVSGSVEYNGTGLAGVGVALTGSGAGSTTTDAGGNYTITGLPNGNYTVTPAKPGFTFTPATPSVTIASASVTQNFTAAAAPIRIDAFSRSSAPPAALLTLTGSGFDPEAALSVRFFNETGYTVTTPAIKSSATTVGCIVPPFINSSTGAIETGLVSVEVIQARGTDTLTSNTLSGFGIGALPSLTLPPGAVSANIAGFLELVISDTQNRLLQLDNFSNGQVNTENLRSELEGIRVQFGQLKTKIRGAIANPGLAETIGEINGVPVTLNQENLLIADQWMVAVLDGILADIQHTSPARDSSLAATGVTGCTQPDDPVLCSMEKTLSGYKTVSGNEVVTSQEFYKVAIAEGRDRLADIGKWFGAVTTTIGAAVVTVGGSIPLEVVAMLTTANVIGNSAIFGMDATTLSINSSDKAAAQKLLDDFNGQIETVATGVNSVILGEISKPAGVLYDLYTGWKPVLEDKIPSYVTQAKTVLSAPTCVYAYSPWGSCQSDSTQTRTVKTSSPAGCVGTPVLTQGCTYIPPACTYTYSAWGACQPDNTQTRTVISSSPEGCVGIPLLTQSCKYKAGSFDGTWEGSINGILTYKDGTHTNWNNVPMWLTIVNNVITSDQPYSSVTGSVDGAGNGSWQIVNGYPSFLFTGIFTSGGNASGTWTYNTDFATGTGTWTATKW